MKKPMLLFTLIIYSFLFSALSACEQKPKNPVAEYGDALMDSRKKAQDAAEKANLDALNKSVQAYHASNDKYPESLQDAANLIGSSVDLSRYDYDPQTGVVSLKNTK
jgi:hypothetical protein